MIEHERKPRPIQSARDIVEVPRATKEQCEHGSLLELAECLVCQGEGRLVDMEQRRHMKVKPLPWNHEARGRDSFIEGMDR